MSTRKRRKTVERPEWVQPIGASSKIKMLIYGDPGAGKTRLIGTGPAETLIIAPPTDHRDSIVGFKGKERIVHNWDDMFETLEWLRESGGGGFDWVWLDSISLVQNTGLDDIWAVTIAEKPARARYGLDKQEYGINMHRLAQWVRHMVGADTFNFGITAHPAELPSPVGDPEEGNEIMMPYVQGKNMASQICGAMQFVGYLSASKRSDGTRVERLDVSGTGRYYGKDQYNAFPKGTVLNPTLPKIVKAIEAARQR